MVVDEAKGCARINIFKRPLSNGACRIELVQWSARHGKTGAPLHILRAMRRDRDRFLAEVRAAWIATGD